MESIGPIVPATRMTCLTPSFFPPRGQTTTALIYNINNVRARGNRHKFLNNFRLFLCRYTLRLFIVCPHRWCDHRQSLREEITINFRIISGNFFQCMPLSLRRKSAVLQPGRAVFAMWRLLFGLQTVHSALFRKKYGKNVTEMLGCFGGSAYLCTRFRPEKGARASFFGRFA